MSSGGRATAPSRRALQRMIFQRFKTRGLSVSAAAARSLMSVLAQEDDVDGSLELILHAIQDGLARREIHSMLIDTDVVTRVVADLTKDDQDIEHESTQLINAEEQPKLVYTHHGKAFSVQRQQQPQQQQQQKQKHHHQQQQQQQQGATSASSSSSSAAASSSSAQDAGPTAVGPPLHGDAESRALMFQERYELIRQRLERNENFAAPLFHTNRQVDHLTLTTIEALLGTRGTRCLLGMITQPAEGQFHLEDLSGHIPIDLSDATVSPGIFTEACFVIVEGEVSEGRVLHVTSMAFPPAEPRATSLTAMGYLDVFGNGTSPQELVHLRDLETRATDAMFVIVSEVHLDRSNVLQKLDELFTGFEQADPLPVFVFMGSFCSRPIAHGTEGIQHMQGLFAALADLIATHERLAREARFVLVPGPADPGAGNTLPRPKLPEIFTRTLREKLQHVAFASNPCRIRFYTQELVFFREDILRKMHRHSLLPPKSPDAGQRDMDVTEHLVKSLLDQGHLCPLPLTARPVHWNYDHSLRLYPVPDLLVLADHTDQYLWQYEGCSVLNSGSFSSDASFVVFRPASAETEFSRVT